MLPDPAAGPKPKNDSVDSAMTAATTASVSATRIGPIEFGSRWRTTMRRSDAPSARDASMNSRSFSASTWPRTRRATPIQPKMANRTMMKRIDVFVADDRLEEGDLAEHVAHDEQGDEEREGEEDVGDPHQDVVEPAAAQAGDGTDRDADDDGDDRRRRGR